MLRKFGQIAAVCVFCCSAPSYAGQLFSGAPVLSDEVSKENDGFPAGLTGEERESLNLGETVSRSSVDALEIYSITQATPKSVVDAFYKTYGVVNFLPHTHHCNSVDYSEWVESAGGTFDSSQTYLRMKLHGPYSISFSYSINTRISYDKNSQVYHVVWSPIDLKKTYYSLADNRTIEDPGEGVHTYLYEQRFVGASVQFSPILKGTKTLVTLVIQYSEHGKKYSQHRMERYLKVLRENAEKIGPH